MKTVKGSRWNEWGCNLQCPCPVRAYVNHVAHCFSLNDIKLEVFEDEARLLTCLENLKDWDMLGRDGELWCPENPF